jgi:hypothetical protein
MAFINPRARLRETSRGLQGVFEIADEIVGVLDADRQPH